MVVVRATQRVLKGLPPAASSTVESATALGDWYVNRIVVDRQHLLVVISSLSLLALLIPARDLRSLPARLPGLVEVRLQRLCVPSDLIEAELAAMEPVVVGPTRDRSVLGTLVEFCRLVPFYLPQGTWDDNDLFVVEDKLAHTPCRASGPDNQVVWPDRDAPELLEKQWRS